MSSTNPYEILFTDGNSNREFEIQPFTTNGPLTPTGPIDPSAVGANTTLYLYGKGAPNYGDRIQENMVYLLEHFFGPLEPSFPVPGQIWSNNSVSPPQLYVYNPYKYVVVSVSGSTVVIQPVNVSDQINIAASLTRFNNLYNSNKSFTIFDASLNPQPTVVQTVAPVLVNNTIELTVTPSLTITPTSSNIFVTGGWEDIFQGNVSNVLRQPLNANSLNIQNLASPVNASDAATKSYVDSAVTGGTILLADLGDVAFQTPRTPRINSVLYYNGTDWTDYLVTSLPFLPLAGGTMTGALILNGDPTTSLGAATKQYVDNQPLSAVSVSLTPPINNNLLAYSSGAGKWINTTALQAGLLPLSGNSSTNPMTGSIVFSNTTGVTVTGVPSPVNASDVATKAYVDATAGSLSGTVITSATYSNTGAGTLTLYGTPSNIVVSGFAPNFTTNPTNANTVAYIPSDPPIVENTTFSQDSLSDISYTFPSNLQNPTNIQLSALLRMLDVQLGRFAEPRKRLVMQGDNSSTLFNIATGSPNTLSGGAPNLQYIVGTHGLNVYVNGVKQIVSDRGFYKMSNINTTTTITGITFSSGTGPATITVPGNYTTVLRQGVVFNISGTSTTNDGAYTVLSSSVSGSNTVVNVTPALLATTPGTIPFVTSGTGTLTYGPFKVMPSMPTGYNFGGLANTVTLDVQVNGAAGVTLSFDTSAVNCNTFGLMCDSVNSMASAYYMNAVVGVTSGASGSFVVAGNRTTQFPASTVFAVRYSSGNSGSYTVTGAGSSYNSTTNQTTIPVTTTIASATIDGVIFQDTWGFTMKIEDGTIVFYSNIAGAGSSVVPVSGTLLTGITGTYWPITISSSFTGITNAFAPSTWGYQEIGLNGYPSQLIVLTTAPNTTDIVEFVIEHDFLFNNTNPIANAITAA